MNDVKAQFDADSNRQQSVDIAAAKRYVLNAGAMLSRGRFEHALDTKVLSDVFSGHEDTGNEVGIG